jgi:hypothetical protein
MTAQIAHEAWETALLQVIAQYAPVPDDPKEADIVTTKQDDSGAVSAAHCELYNRHLLAYEAAGRGGRLEYASAMLLPVFTSLSSGVMSIPEHDDVECKIPFPSEKAEQCFHREYPPLPPSRRHIAAAFLWRRARNCFGLDSAEISDADLLCTS